MASLTVCNNTQRSSKHTIHTAAPRRHPRSIFGQDYKSLSNEEELQESDSAVDPVNNSRVGELYLQIYVRWTGASAFRHRRTVLWPRLLWCVQMTINGCVFLRGRDAKSFGREEVSRRPRLGNVFGGCEQNGLSRWALTPKTGKQSPTCLSETYQSLLASQTR